MDLTTDGFAYSADSKVLDSLVAFASDTESDRSGKGLLTVGEVVDDRPRLSTVGSLWWSVLDEATALPMRRRDTRWFVDVDRLGKADALRRAQADVRGRRDFSAPGSGRRSSLSAPDSPTASLD